MKQILKIKQHFENINQVLRSNMCGKPCMSCDPQSVVCGLTPVSCLFPACDVIGAKGERGQT